VTQQGLRGRLREDDAVAAVRGLGRFEGLAVAGDERPSHAQHAEVQVGPEQAPDLSEAHPGGQAQHVQRVVPVRFGGLEEPFRLVPVERAYLRRGHPRRGRHLANVAPDQASPDGAVQDREENPVYAPYPGRREPGCALARVHPLHVLPRQVLEPNRPNAGSRCTFAMLW
jgi:hypothetical protein